MNKGKDRRNGPEYRLCKGAILWFAILPSYYLIYNLLLFGTTTTQIDTGSFYAFMSHEVSKQRYVIELLQKILGKPMTERVRINDFLIHTVFCGIVLRVMSSGYKFGVFCHLWCKYRNTQSEHALFLFVSIH